MIACLTHNSVMSCYTILLYLVIWLVILNIASGYFLVIVQLISKPRQ